MKTLDIVIPSFQRGEVLLDTINALHKQADHSIPNAMNIGLLRANSDLVLFLDDDISPSESLLAQHKQAYSDDVVAVVGQILQPGEVPVTVTDYPNNQGFDADLVFPFYSDKEKTIQNCMAGNLSVNRQAAIDCGGFDTNFIAVAYRFETEFCRRLIKHSGKNLIIV